jgi:hypothetical protein
MNDTQEQLLIAIRELTEQMGRLNSYLQYGAMAHSAEDQEIREALRAISSGEEPCVFMAESSKVYEA